MPGTSPDGWATTTGGAIEQIAKANTHTHIARPKTRPLSGRGIDPGVMNSRCTSGHPPGVNGNPRLVVVHSRRVDQMKSIRPKRVGPAFVVRFDPACTGEHRNVGQDDTCTVAEPPALVDPAPIYRANFDVGVGSCGVKGGVLAIARYEARMGSGYSQQRSGERTCRDNWQSSCSGCLKGHCATPSCTIPS